MRRDILDEVYAEGVEGARSGEPREANPYCAPLNRAAWFAGFDDAVARPNCERELTGAEILGYIVVALMFLGMMYLPN